jgi:hypothetical protein
MRAAVWLVLISLVLMVTACAETHTRDEDAYVPIVVDPTAEIGPRCPPLPTPCLEPSSEGRSVVPPDRLGQIVAIDLFEDRTDILLRIDDWTVGTNRFVLVRFERGTVTSTELEQTEGPPFSGTFGDVRSYTDHTRVTWDLCRSTIVAERCETVETRRTTVPLDAASVDFEITSRGPGRSNPQFLTLDGAELVAHWVDGGFELDDGSSQVFVAWPSSDASLEGHAVGSLGGARWLGVVFSGTPGFGPEAALFDGGALESVASESVLGLAVVGGEVWDTRFEPNEDDLSMSRIRVTHRSPTDLRRIEPDRWADGWGGRAVGHHVGPYLGRPWLFILAPDVRYDPLVLHMVPLDGPACGRAVDQAAWLSPVAEDEGLLHVLSNEGRIAVVRQTSEAIEVTSLRACTP